MFDVSITNWKVQKIITEDKLYIDTVLQAETPSLPDPTTTIKLNNIAAIGYPDDITEQSCMFKVYSEILDQTKIDEDYAEITACENVLMHNGEVVTYNGVPVTNTPEG